MTRALSPFDAAAARGVGDTPCATEAAIAAEAEKRVAALRSGRGALDRWIRLEAPDLLTHAEEHPERAALLLASLERANRWTGGHRRVLRLLRAELGPGPARVLEIASGSGGLALSLARAGLTVTASERTDTLVDAIAARAAAERVSLSSRVLDARALDTVAADTFDAVLMVQAERYFPPPELARMLLKSRRIARRVTMLVGGRRGLTALAAYACAGAVLPGAGHGFRGAARRLYTEAELSIIAELASEGDTVELTRVAPAQVALILRRRA